MSASMALPDVSGDGRLPGADNDMCPVCRSSRYLSPNLRFLMNPECYHRMCESCVDRIFSHGPAPCPIAGCHRTLRKQRFRKQTFEDIRVEKEVDIRRRVAQTFNRRPEEFTSLRTYNDYLEEVEMVTFNLLNNVDVAATEKKLAAYAAQNQTSISRNLDLQRQESASVEATQALERDHVRHRRETARLEEEEERLSLDKERRTVIDRLARGDGDAETIAREGQRVLLKRSSARRTMTQAQPQSTVPRATSAIVPPVDPSYTIKGLKPILAVEPEKPIELLDADGINRQYFVVQDEYESPWLDRARNEPTVTAGGYQVQEYIERSLLEAFSGLGVFVEEEVTQRDTGLADLPSMATKIAATVSGTG